jgi:hypothetical protein
MSASPAISPFLRFTIALTKSGASKKGQNHLNFVARFLAPEKSFSAKMWQATKPEISGSKNRENFQWQFGRPRLRDASIYKRQACKTSNHIGLCTTLTVQIRHVINPFLPFFGVPSKSGEDHHVLVVSKNQHSFQLNQYSFPPDVTLIIELSAPLYAASLISIGGRFLSFQ